MIKMKFQKVVISALLLLLGVSSAGATNCTVSNDESLNIDAKKKQVNISPSRYQHIRTDKEKMKMHLKMAKRRDHIKKMKMLHKKHGTK